MRAARQFAQDVCDVAVRGDVDRIRVELYGSLSATGVGHATDRAIVLGLSGEVPETVSRSRADALVAGHTASGTVNLLGSHVVSYSADDLIWKLDRLPGHSNGLRFLALDGNDRVVVDETFYSIGGGSIRRAGYGEQQSGNDAALPFASARELLAACAATGLPISGIVRMNEEVERSPNEVSAGLQGIWRVMEECVRAGLAATGVLPGPLSVPRRAHAIHQRLLHTDADPLNDPLIALDWVSAFAIAVNEENAAGGRIVTAPTNGAAGIVPAVLHFYQKYTPGAHLSGVEQFLLCASAIGSLIKQNASISGAEMGCQGEVGSACAMAAAGLCEVLGGSPKQVENAAEIALEHHLGLTCDPVAGLVQIPCIERNAIGAVKAISAARLALNGQGDHTVSLDMAIETLRSTGMDMKAEYKETSRAGLAVNVIEC
ncbi:L-serine ammonia-lyase [Mycobacterium sp. 21AC1]|nr:L-serine ammonia-lyase [Mycobacterium sp. 21AC1]